MNSKEPGANPTKQNVFFGKFPLFEGKVAPWQWYHLSFWRFPLLYRYHCPIWGQSPWRGQSRSCCVSLSLKVFCLFFWTLTPRTHLLGFSQCEKMQKNMNMAILGPIPVFSAGSNPFFSYVAVYLLAFPGSRGFCAVCQPGGIASRKSGFHWQVTNAAHCESENARRWWLTETSLESLASAKIHPQT